MYIESIENQKLTSGGATFDIIELKVRGDISEREKFLSDIGDIYSIANDDWIESLAMLILTFDKVPKEQTVSIIKSYTKNWIEISNQNKARQNEID